MYCCLIIYFSKTVYIAKLYVVLYLPIQYIYSSVGWGRKMSVPCIGAVLRARKRTRVTVVNSTSLCIRSPCLKFHIIFFDRSIN